MISHKWLTSLWSGPPCTWRLHATVGQNRQRQHYNSDVAGGNQETHTHTHTHTLTSMQELYARVG